MRGKRAKELRRAAELLSDTWREYVAVRQRNTYGFAVQPKVADNGCVLRTGFGIELGQDCGRRKYKRMKLHYKRLRSRPGLYQRKLELLRGEVK